MGALEFSISPDILFSSVCLHFTVGHPLLFMLYCYWNEWAFLGVFWFAAYLFTCLFHTWKMDSVIRRIHLILCLHSFSWWKFQSVASYCELVFLLSLLPRTAWNTVWERERVSLCFPFSSWPSLILSRYRFLLFRVHF